MLVGSWSGLPPRSVAAAMNILLPMVLLVPFGWLIGLFSVQMLAQGRHANTLLESVPAIVIAAFVLVLGGSGIRVLAWATCAGFLCHAVSLAIPLRRELTRPRFAATSPQWSQFRAGFTIMLVGQFLTSFTTVADQFFAARLSAGALASIGYAQRILALILGLGTTVVGRATIPVITRAAESDDSKLRDITMHWVRIVFGGGIVAVALGWLLAPVGVRVLFERGAFSAQDTQAVVTVFRAGLLQMPFNFAAVLLFYGLAGRRKYVALTVVSALVLVVKIAMNSLLVPTWGAQGVMISTAAVYLTLMVSYLYLLRRTDGVVA
jgi:putative peptidoglycan lipid II flippase